MPPNAHVGDRFDEALEASRRFLLSIANAKLPDALRSKGGASDLVQDTLALAHQCRDTFRGQTMAELRAWLRTILSNEVAAFRRRYTDTDARDIRREAELGYDSAVTRAEPIDVLLQSERDDRLVSAVADLPEDGRYAVCLRIEQGLSFAAIGERLGRSEAAARKLFVRAIGQLRGTVPSTDE
jgi:RNA polymerase sigma-70 factor (ECF subfamily)